MKKDNVELICGVAELTSLFEQTANLRDFLQKVVSVVAWHMKAAVCSVYLVDAETQELVLTANQGLNPEAVGKMRLHSGEGIIGQVMKAMQPIREARGPSSPYYKLVPELQEGPYEAFLAVPITRHQTCVGVLAVQDPQPDYFDENDTKALRAIAVQLANVIENARLLMSLARVQGGAPSGAAAPEGALGFVHGIPASVGVAFGRALVLGDRDTSLRVPPNHSGRTYTVADFHHAMEATRDQLAALQKQVGEELADVASLIFSAHLLILRDEDFAGAMLRRIEQGTPPPEAIVDSVNEFVHLFAASPIPHLQEKAQDLKDLGHRLLRNLLSETPDDADCRNRIVIAAEPLPSDIVKMVAQRTAGLILVSGGVTAHVSILARALRLPVVIVRDRRLFELAPDTEVLLDGGAGNICISPTEEVRNQYRQLEDAQRRVEALAANVAPETTTRDGERVHLLANINLLSELEIAVRLKAEGVGLYRSEFPFIVRNDFPSEEEQYRIYRTVSECMGDRPVSFRTLDIGGDKMLSYMPIPNELNPFLGLRAIRFSLRHRDIFVQQLRALLRAGADRELRVMFPLISSLDEFLQVRDAVLETVDALRREGVPHNDHPILGVMVEMPSAVEMIDDLCQYAGFLSVGSNDLIQYLLAVDRTNEQVADLYLAYHPAVLRALRRVAGAAQRHRVPVSVCGEVATDPRLIPFLLGIGIRTLSMDARVIPSVQKLISTLDILETRAFAQSLLSLNRIRDIAALLNARRSDPASP